MSVDTKVETLEKENAQLKRLVADLSLDDAISCEAMHGFRPVWPCAGTWWSASGKSCRCRSNVSVGRWRNLAPFSHTKAQGRCRNTADRADRSPGESVCLLPQSTHHSLTTYVLCQDIPYNVCQDIPDTIGMSWRGRSKARLLPVVRSISRIYLLRYCTGSLASASGTPTVCLASVLATQQRTPW